MMELRQTDNSVPIRVQVFKSRLCQVNVDVEIHRPLSIFTPALAAAAFNVTMSFAFAAKQTVFAAAFAFAGWNVDEDYNEEHDEDDDYDDG